MIKSVSIKNFKSIKDQTIVLGKVTTFVGKSEQGKSNFIRALAQLSYNGGCNLEDTITHGECGFRISEVVTHKSEDFEVTVERSKKKERGLKFTDGFEPDLNRYRIRNLTQNLPEVVIDKVGVYVPDQVKEILEMDMVEFDEDLKIPLNYREQLSGIFVLDLSPTKKSVFIGKISPAINALNMALKNSITDSRTVKSNLDNRYQPELEILIKETKAIEELIKKDEANLKVLESLGSRISLEIQKAESVKKHLQIKADLDKVVSRAAVVANLLTLETKSFDSFDLLSKVQKFVELKEAFVQTNKSLKKSLSLMILLEKLEYNFLLRDSLVVYIDKRDLYKKVLTGINIKSEISMLSEKFWSVLDRYDKFVMILLDYKSKSQDSTNALTLVNSGIQENQKNMLKLDSEYSVLMSSLAECPTCGATKNAWTHELVCT